MSLRVLSSTELLLAIKTSLVYIRLLENEIDKFELPDEKPEKDEEDDDVVQLPPGVQNLALSGDKNYVAVSTRQKYLYVFRLESHRPFKLLQIAKLVLSRVSNRLRFSDDSQKLLIADKTGDCFLWQFLSDEPPLPVCGHLSMVMDVLFTENEASLVTCDRDEKIRVTSYPDTHNLLSYCMGHKEYVAQVELLPHNNKWLASISGDQTVRFWDFAEGREIFKLPLTGPGAYMTCWKSGENSSTIVCNIYRSQKLEIFEVQTNSDGDGLKMKSMKGVDLTEHTTFRDLQNCDGAILTLTFNKDFEKVAPHLMKLEYDSESRSYKPLDLSAINERLQKEFSDLHTEDRDDVAVLFKKRVNNIIHYHERKRKRIEEKSK